MVYELVFQIIITVSEVLQKRAEKILDMQFFFSIWT